MTIFSRSAGPLQGVFAGDSSVPLACLDAQCKAYRAARVAPRRGGRYGRGDEVSEAIVFIASDAPRDITGQNLRVAGGITRSV